VDPLTYINVLIIDDEEEIVSLFSKMLSRSTFPFFSVTTCYDLEYLNCNINSSVDVVLLDLNLKSSRGLETLKRFLLMCPKTPVVVITGSTEVGLAYECFQLGVSDFIIKPNVSDILLQKVCVYSIIRHKALAELEQTQAKLSGFMDAAPIGLGTAAYRRIISVNSFLCKMLGYSEEELVGQDARIIYSDEEEYQRVGNLKYNNFREQKKVAIECKWKKKTGEIIDIYLCSNFINSEDSSANVIFTAMDITELNEAKKQIEKARDKAQNYLNIAGTMILALNNKAEVVLINKKGCEIVGLPQEEVLGKNWINNFVPLESREETWLIFNTLMFSKEVIEDHAHINWIECKGGGRRLIKWQNTIGKTNGYILSSGEDITDAHYMQEELRKSEAKYRSVVETAGEGIIITQNEVVKLINKSITDLFGYTEEDMVGHSMYEFLHPDSVDEVKSNHLKRMAGEILDSKNYVIKGFDKSRNIKYVDYRVTTVDWGGSPASLGFVSDITEKLTLEQRQHLIIDILRVLNEPYSGKQTVKTILEKIREFTGADAVAIRLKDGHDYPYFVYKGFSKEFIDAENYLCKYGADSGCLVTEPSGKPVLECMCGCVIRGYVDKSLPFFTENGSFWINGSTSLRQITPKELMGNTRNTCNTEGYESIAIIPLKAGEEIIGTLQINDKREYYFSKELIEFMERLAASIGVAVKRVWTEEALTRIEIAKTQDLLEASRFLNAGIAHELRTPLQAILNSFEYIKTVSSEECADQESQCNCKAEVSEIASEGIDRTDYAIQVLDSLAEYSKIASSSEKHLINLFIELKTILTTLRYTDQFKSFTDDTLKLEGKPIGCSIRMNRVDFQQLIVNLCKNAREAIQHDDPVIGITLYTDNNDAIIRVRDNGRGISHKIGNKIFEPFFSTKDNPESQSQGLGLAIVKNIVTAYGGTVDYNSRPGDTEFIVRFPCDKE